MTTAKAKKKPPGAKPRKAGGPRRYGVGDCLLPLAAALGAAAVALLVVGLPESAVWRVLAVSAAAGVLVAWWRIWDMGPWR